jgi:hypothetical protein
VITARNYAAQAEAGLLRYADRCEKIGFKRDAESARKLSSAIKHSVHFAIQDGGEIFDDKLKGLRGEMLRLPYRMITVEYFVNKNDDNVSDAAPVHAPKRVAVAVDSDKELTLSLCDNQTRFMMSKFPGDRIITIYAVDVIEGLDHWIPMPFGLMLPSCWDAVPNDAVIVKPLIDRRDQGAGLLAGIPTILLQDMFDHNVKAGGIELAIQEGLHDISAETRAVLELCEALSCSNVTSDVLQPASSKNAKRISDKKLPIYETRCLSIIAPTTTSGRSEGLGGTHRSPRQHLRRGHIRRIAEERKIWVNSCVVGAKSQGVIEKTYTVST